MRRAWLKYAVRPKQFLPLFGKHSTEYDPAGVGPVAIEHPIVVTDVAYRFMVLERFAEIGIKRMCC